MFWRMDSLAFYPTEVLILWLCTDCRQNYAFSAYALKWYVYSCQPPCSTLNHRLIFILLIVSTVILCLLFNHRVVAGDIGLQLISRQQQPLHLKKMAIVENGLWHYTIPSPNNALFRPPTKSPKYFLGSNWQPLYNTYDRQFSFAAESVLQLLNFVFKTESHCRGFIP